MRIGLENRIARATRAAAISVVALIAALGLAAAPADASTRDPHSPSSGMVEISDYDFQKPTPTVVEYTCTGSHCTCDSDSDCLVLAQSGVCEGRVEQGTCKTRD